MTERTCRYCGCVEARVCVFFNHSGDAVPCWWIAEDVCSNPVCDAALNEKLVERVAHDHLEGIQPKALAIVQQVARIIGGHEIVDDGAEDAVCMDHD